MCSNSSYHCVEYQVSTCALPLFHPVNKLRPQVTSGMVIGTILSAPIMYVSAWLLSMPWMDAQLLMNSLQNVSFNMSIVSLVALVSSV